MKKVNLLFFVTMVLSLGLTAQDHSYKRYKAESGIIEYEVSGSQTGIETLYFDNYGVKEAKYTDVVMDMMGMQQKTNQVVFLDGYNQYTVNLETKTGTKTENSMLKQIAESPEDKDLNELGMSMMVSMGGEKIRDEHFQGKDCEVWQIENMGTTVWIWNYISLKTETDMMGMKITYKAIDIQINVSIPADKISVPNDIQFKEFDMNDIQNLMKGQ